MSKITEETARRIARLGRIVAAISTVVVVVVKSEQHGDYLTLTIGTYVLCVQEYQIRAHF